MSNPLGLLPSDVAHPISQLRRAVADATAVSFHLPVSLNKHFVVGRSVKSFYTGREKQMAKLKAAFEQPGFAAQKRFVVYGLGGSGKTELALKYAQDHMQNFWGVFFVDASSRKSAAGSYAEISKIGGVEPNERAAQNWLATRALPWLLIVDNADDDEVQLEALLPAGTNGCILVTSRNPAHKSYGTVGERHLELLPMDMEEANELILKVAEEPSPWSKTVKESASLICQALGFLPLALVHAGKAVLLNLCSWGGYLAFYDSHTERIRRERFHRRDRSLSRNRRRSKEDDDSMNVFSSYEILYQALELCEEENFRDAVQLLHVFSYFHFQDIRLDTLIAAAIGPIKEAKQRENSVKEDGDIARKLAALQGGAWSGWFRAYAYRLYGYLEIPPPMPDALKNIHELDEANFTAEVNFRLRTAMVVLVSRSLVMKQDRLEDRYSIHPLVHKWIRERPQLSTSQQALWCQISSTILARSILIPPLGDSEDERSRRGGLLPHIMHVRRWQEIINDRLEENRKLRKSIWPVAKMKFGRLQAEEAGRFSRVYSERGLFREASQLQSQTRDFLIQMVGEENLMSLRVTLFLAGTLWELSRTNEATELQRRVYEICLKALGSDHPMTLNVMDKLASSICFQGRLTEALTLHEKAVEGMKRVYGEGHVSTLHAINNTGRVHFRFFDFQRAAEHHRYAWEGMKKLFDETHLLALEYLEDLSISRMRLGDEYLADCHEKMQFVLEQRKKLLGKEHPYTLLALCNLGRVKSAMGRHDEAIKLMQQALYVAERNLDADHFGVLAAKTYYAQALTHHGQVEEAEKVLNAVAEKRQYKKASARCGTWFAAWRSSESLKGHWRYARC
jgi:tetratricopeptide (TPR) repeat protein